MKKEDTNNLKEMLVDFNEYSTDYTKTRCRELEETIKNTLDEIERLNKQIEEYQKALDETTSEKINLENIIKEVRKYIKEHIRIDDEYPAYMEMLLEEYKELLEILDKGE